MNRLVAVATVADPGAAEEITVALTEAGINARAEPVATENPYLASALVSLRIFVPADQVGQAAGVLTALELDVARDFHAQAGVNLTTSNEDDEAERLRRRAARRRSFASVWLGFVVPFPITCWSVGARLPGTIFLGVFVGTMAKLFLYERGTAPAGLAWLLAGAKVGDLMFAVATLIWRRARG